MKTGLDHLHPHPEQVPLAALQPQPADVFLILRRIVSRWNTTARVVAVHQDEASALTDLAAYRAYEPNWTFAIFRLMPEKEPDA